MDSLIFGVVVIGLLHGLEPGHGWPMALLYAINKPKPYRQAVGTSLILAACHFSSSITAALIYVIAAEFFDASAIWFQIGAIVMLVVLAVRCWREKVGSVLQTEEQHDHLHGNAALLVHSHEHVHLNGETHVHEHSHAKGFPITLRGMAVYGLVLGFAHEEEFALLALAIGGMDPWLLMTAYGLCVTASLVGVTILGVGIYNLLGPWMKARMKYIPKINAVTLLVLAVILTWELVL